MAIQVRATPDGLSLSGELDMGSADEFRRFATTVVDRSRKVVLDISELAFVDSAGIEAILRFAETDCPHGLILLHPPENVLRALDYLGVEKVVGISVERR